MCPIQDCRFARATTARAEAGYPSQLLTTLRRGESRRSRKSLDAEPASKSLLKRGPESVFLNTALRAKEPQSKRNLLDLATCKRQCPASCRKSRRCRFRLDTQLLDELVRAHQDRRRDREAERLGHPSPRPWPAPAPPRALPHRRAGNRKLSGLPGHTASAGCLGVCAARASLDGAAVTGVVSLLVNLASCAPCKL